jgi:hypothetical protein
MTLVNSFLLHLLLNLQKISYTINNSVIFLMREKYLKIVNKKLKMQI